MQKRMLGNMKSKLFSIDSSLWQLLLVVCLGFTLASCGRDDGNPIYKIGTPYTIDGVWYHPERDLGYDETGLASWYGHKEKGRLTANGEIFHPGRITAAHKTLPMPSAVRVTNLENGRSISVRINDRGPFVPGRIIDLSTKGAELLGFRERGVARVRVQALVDETLRLERLARTGRFRGLKPRLRENDPLAFPENQAQAQASHSQIPPSRQTSTQTPPPRPAQPRPPVTPPVAPPVKPMDSVVGESIDSVIASIDNLGSVSSANLRVGQPVATTIWVQIGAFIDEDNAFKASARVADIARANISPVQKGEQLFHRVRIGPIANVADADRILDSVIRRGFAAATILVE